VSEAAPGAGAEARAKAGEACITCGDVAVPLRVVGPGSEPGLAVCADAAGGRETVEIALVGPVSPGERLLVHAGTAIARLEEGA
jgi:hydrogenase expression/formation protein HypC